MPFAPSLKLRTKLFLATLLITTSCASQPPDIDACVELTPTRGYCTAVISDREFMVDEEHKLDGETWWEAKASMVMVPYKSWTRLKTWMIQQCKHYQNCDQRIYSWDRTIEEVIHSK